ncbi:ATP-binding protein [bacterium]|nr:ATP-binding protein [bacterium]
MHSHIEHTIPKMYHNLAMSKAITSTRSLGTLVEILQDISKALVQILEFDQSWIGIINENESLIEGKAGFGIDVKKKEIGSCYLISADSQNPVVMAVVQKKPIINLPIKDMSEEFGIWLKKMCIQSHGYFPIFNRNKVIGVFGTFYYTNQIFEKDDIKTLISLSELVAIVIENAQLHEKNRTSEERYKTLFETSCISLAIIDDQHRIHLVNQAFESMSGYTREALIQGMTLNQFLSGESHNRNKTIKKMNLSPQSWEGHFIDKNGSVKQVRMTVTQIAGSSNRLISMIDITQQKELERQLNRSEELASIGELSAGIAHEIRNPLVAITTSVNLLKDEAQLSEEGQQLLDIVKEESDHLAVIVDDFLKYARPKKPSFQKENINKLVQDVVKKFKEYNGYQTHWVECYNNNLPSIYIDRHQIQQVITNLLLNSFDAMPNNGVLTIRTQKRKSLGIDQILISITDSGVGIAKEEISKIFQPFYSTKEKGTGMGLAICKRIINEHDGEILVKSELGKKTTFSVIFPIQKKSKIQE